MNFLVHVLTCVAVALCVSLATGAPIVIDMKSVEVPRETALLTHRIYSQATGRYVQITRSGRVNANAPHGK